MSSRLRMSYVIRWFAIAFCDCSSVCFILSFSLLQGMEENSEVTSNDTIWSSLSNLAVRIPSKNSFDDSMVVVESAASNEIIVDSHLATPYRGEFRRSTFLCRRA